jgi:hypothetical protein
MSNGRSLNIFGCVVYISLEVILSVFNSIFPVSDYFDVIYYTIALKGEKPVTNYYYTREEI